MKSLSCNTEEFDFILKIKRSQYRFAFLKDHFVLLEECFGEEQDERQEN